MTEKYVARSDNGIDWDLLPSGPLEIHPTSTVLVRYNNGHWVVGARYDGVYTSDDGDTFVETDVPDPSNGFNIDVSSDGTWMIGAVNNGVDNNGLYRSDLDDPSTWTALDPQLVAGGDFFHPFTNVFWVTGSIWIAYVINASVKSLTDGDTWAGTTGGPPGPYANDGSRIVGARQSLAPRYSDDDGDTWTECSVFPGTDPWVNDIAYSASLGLWVMVGALYEFSSGIWTSVDGDVWVAQDSPYTYDVEVGTDLAAVVWSEALELFIAVGGIYTGNDATTYPLIATSPDGETWTARSIPDNPNGYIYGVDTDEVGNLRAAGWFQESTIVELGESTPGVITFSSNNPTLTVSKNTKLIVNDDKSTAPHGFYFWVEVKETIEYLKIYDPNDLSWSFEVVPRGGFLEGDVVAIYSDWDRKEVAMRRGSTITHLADVVTPGSIWPLIFPGENTFELLPKAVAWSQLWHYPTYWGV